MKIEQHPLFSNQTHQANRDFLYHAVDVYYQMKSLVSGNGTVELCNQLFGGAQVYKGIEQLAFAAGKSPKTNWSGMKNIRLKLLLNSAVSVFIN